MKNLRDWTYWFTWDPIPVGKIFNAMQARKIKNLLIVAPEEINTIFFQDRKSLDAFIKFCKKCDVEFKALTLSPTVSSNTRWFGLTRKDYFLYWECFFGHQLVHYNIRNNIPLHKPQNIKKHFIMLNRRARSNRCLMVDLLFHKDLFDSTFISWHDVDNTQLDYTFKYWTPKLMALGDEEEVGTLGALPREFSQSFMHIVVESTLDSICITEKTYNPIYHLQPFIIYGHPGIHAYLESLGFKMYHSIIDYSFDNIDNDVLRCEMLTDELKKLSSQAPQNLYADIFDIVLYNHKHLLKLIFEGATNQWLYNLFTSNSHRLSHYYLDILQNDQKRWEEYKNMINYKKYLT